MKKYYFDHKITPLPGRAFLSTIAFFTGGTQCSSVEEAILADIANVYSQIIFFPVLQTNSINNLSLS